MAKIAKSEYPKIQQMVSVEGRKVPEIAGLYGCTPANIYAILSKLRRQGDVASPTASATPDRAPVQEHPAEMPLAPEGSSGAATRSRMSGDLLAAIEGDTTRPTPSEASSTTVDGQTASALLDQPEHDPQAAEAVIPPVEERPGAAVSEPRRAPELPSTPASNARTNSTPLSLVSAKPAKVARPGYALCMRASDGDESSTPFRSLDDLLSAVRPILRSAARRSDQIWFSIQQVDLTDLDSEAA